jgi:hypothetical protein
LPPPQQHAAAMIAPRYSSPPSEFGATTTHVFNNITQAFPSASVPPMHLPLFCRGPTQSAFGVFAFLDTGARHSVCHGIFHEQIGRTSLAPPGQVTITATSKASSYLSFVMFMFIPLARPPLICTRIVDKPDHLSRCH